MTRWGLAILLVASSATANEPTPAIAVSGYLSPQAGVLYRPSAKPRDRWEYGAGATSAGVVATGAPLPRWSYAVHLVFAGESLEVVSAVTAVDLDGDGKPDDVAATTKTTPAFRVEDVSVSYAPVEAVKLTLGQLRIPFTVEQQITNTALVFPQRSDANAVFLSGTDLGGLATATVGGGLVQAAAGVFNGTGAPAGTGNERGLLYALRLDASPFGSFPLTQGDPARGPLRLALGGGLLYYPAHSYDPTGFPGSELRDLRMSASLRLALRGLYFQGEVLRRQRTDSLSSRPRVATGAYGQASFHVPITDGLAAAPIARVGWATEDQSFAPRETVWIEAGLAFYPKPKDPEALKVVAQYLGVHRLTEREDAHGATVQVQLSW